MLSYSINKLKETLAELADNTKIEKESFLNYFNEFLS
ncbi:hypothetical protein BH23BAC1_BH23BAC1_49040 [soil metagenome]